MFQFTGKQFSLGVSNWAQYLHATFRKGYIQSSRYVSISITDKKFNYRFRIYYVHMEIVLIKERRVCVWGCQYCEGLGDYKAN